MNLFKPLYFGLDANCFYHTEPLYPVRLLYLGLATIFLVIGLATSNAPKRHKRIMVTFVSLPILNAVLTFFTQSISTQYVATLVSIVLVYSVVYADRSNLLASDGDGAEYGGGYPSEHAAEPVPGVPYPQGV